MSSIWNPQDRYVLSNMTSQKLYAKSPLTTGVSGTSAYIGLEPSATYNETVLWSTDSPDTKTSGTLNDSIWNYERFKMYINTFQGGDYVTELVATGTSPGTATRSFITYGPRGNNDCSFDMCKWIFSDTGFSAVSAKSFHSTWTATAITVENNQTAALGYCHKIVGINRKEV